MPYNEMGGRVMCFFAYLVSGMDENFSLHLGQERGELLDELAGAAGDRPPDSPDEGKREGEGSLFRGEESLEELPFHIRFGSREAARGLVEKSGKLRGNLCGHPKPLVGVAGSLRMEVADA